MKKSALFFSVLISLSAALLLSGCKVGSKKDTVDPVVSTSTSKRSIASAPPIEPVDCENETGAPIKVMLHNSLHTLSQISFEPPADPSSNETARVHAQAFPEMGARGGFGLFTDDGDCTEDDHWGWSCKLTENSHLKLTYNATDKTCALGLLETMTPEERRNECFSCMGRCPHLTRNMLECDYGCPRSCSDEHREEYERLNPR